jgi:hypothetical protein
MANEQIEAIERDIKKAKASVDFGKLVLKLKGNRDFQKVVLEGYFEQEAIRLVHLKASPHMQAPDKQAYIVGAIDAIGAFKGYLDAALWNADQAAASLESSEAELADALQEQAGE